MKVLHVLPFPGVGGTEIATRRIADATRPFGIEHRALLLRPGDEQIDYLREAGIPWLAATPGPEPSFRSGRRFLRDSRALAAGWGKVDLLHCADVGGAYYTALAGRLAGIPVLSHVRNRHPALPWRDRVFIGAATHFAFVSRSTRGQFALRVADRRATIVYDGIDVPAAAELGGREAIRHSVRAEFGFAAATPIAAMFARVNPQKDYATLVRAAALLRDSHPGLRFLIVGDHAEIAENRRHYGEVRAMMEAAGVAARFVFAGFRRDTRRLMLAADLCLLSTHFEGLPLVIIEAMALGRPNVATAVDGVPEALEHGRTGLLHAHADATDLAGCIARVLDDPAQAERLGRAARAEAERRFSRERFAADMHALYRRLQGRGRQAQAESACVSVGMAAGRDAGGR